MLRNSKKIRSFIMFALLTYALLGCQQAPPDEHLVPATAPVDSNSQTQDRLIKLLKQMPEFRDYKVKPALIVINAFIAAGKAASVKAISACTEPVVAASLERDRAMVLLIRCLFESSDESTWAPPGLGYPGYDVLRMDLWPDFPIAIYENTPFLLVEGYELEGKAEFPMQYWLRCVESMHFRTKPLGDGHDAVKAAHALIDSDAFQNKLTANARQLFQVKAFIVNQAEP